jgi:hypothetical protein
VNEFLEPLWAAFDADAPVFDSDYVAAWPDGALDWLLKVKLVGRAANATHVVCPGCHDRHVEEVQSVVMPDGTRRFYVTCPEVMRAWVTDSILVRYQPDFAVLARQLKCALGIEGRVRDRIADRLWRIGECPLGRKKYEVFVARLPDDARSKNVFAEIPPTGKRIVLIGRTPPAIEHLSHSIPAIIPLPAVTTVTSDGIALDGARFAQLVHEWEEMVKDCGGNRDELRRFIASEVERVVQQGPTLGLIADGVREGKSTREIEADLKKRGLPKDHATIARVIRRAKDTGGKSSVPSSRSVVRHASSQPRDNRGRPRPDAQPEEEE